MSTNPPDAATSSNNMLGSSGAASQRCQQSIYEKSKLQNMKVFFFNGPGGQTFMKFFAIYRFHHTLASVGSNCCSHSMRFLYGVIIKLQ